MMSHTTLAGSCATSPFQLKLPSMLPDRPYPYCVSQRTLRYATPPPSPFPESMCATVRLTPPMLARQYVRNSLSALLELLVTVHGSLAAPPVQRRDHEI